ncbi:thiol reductant ABC exporter subunit CydC [Mesorhizobium sp. NZP2077]|uniref:thiol reductant ABC exporter subunit CydC n=1 Tax=Mesorhizobium sp. NZP2077 TaxID=2483404 RepID=UPI001552A48A|nr:thiol reductant ABC exporter subunit CydC [Mesorhizobium sp. NZP2077]QKC85218.1 thiol reductant ABC exporter subunit CydC [Mesorhizobium sp. NZP2077]QKD18855.1 thiol reductant ABC exporter subunit CydC [Mesorhizobium sp. NZP2077]
MTAFWFFRPLFQRHAARLAWTLLLSVITLAAGIALLSVSGWFLTAAALTTAAASFNLFGPSSLIRGLSFIRILSRYGEKVFGHDTTLRLLADLRGWLFASLFPRVPLADRGLRHGDLVSRLTADVDALDTVFLVAIGPMLAALLLGSAMATALWVFIPAAGVSYAILVGFAVLGVPAVLILASRRMGTELVEASAAARIAVLDGIDGHADLIAFGETATARASFAGSAARLAASRRRLGMAGSLAAAVTQALAGAAMISVLWFGIVAVHAGTIGGPLLAGLLLGTIASFEATGAVVRGVARLGVSAAAAARLKAISTARPMVNDPARPDPLPSGDVRFESVVFGHDRRRPVLRGLDLSVKQGSRVAIIGPSGSGKSTVLALLLRLYDPQAGTISIGGVDIRTVAQRDLHEKVSLLSQDSPVVLGTIRENLLIGRADANDAALWHALASARLADFVRGLPEGLGAFVGETGRTLSVGQARRLCLARTLLSQADILAFDEPTSGLDREAELAFLADVNAATAGRTVILATHAALPLGAADHILRMVDGRLETA